MRDYEKYIRYRTFPSPWCPGCGIGVTLKAIDMAFSELDLDPDDIQLIDAEHGFHLWSNEYDRGLDDVFATQDEIASAVTAALVPRLKAEDAPKTRGGTTNVDAYDEYLRGREKWRTRDIESLHESVDHFRAAVELDPEFALAWSGIADAIDALAWRDTATLELIPEGRLAALRALALDPEMAEGWVSAGVLAAEFDRDHELGELALRRALSLRPSYANANQQLSGLLRNVGRVNESGEYIEKAVELDPLSPFFHVNYGDNLLVAGEVDRAREQYELTEELGQDGTGFRKLLFYARQLGLTTGEAASVAEGFATRTGLSDPADWRIVGEAIVDEARREEALAVIDRSDGLPPRREQQLRLTLGQHEVAIAYIQRMWKSGAGDVWRIGTMPENDPLREDPRFIEIVKDLGIPNGWDPVTKTAIWP